MSCIYLEISCLKMAELTLNFPQSGGIKGFKYNFTGSCRESLAVSFQKDDASDTWYSIANDEGNKEVTISASTNTTLDERSGTVLTYISTTACTSKNVIIKQNNMPNYLTFIAQEDGTFTFTNNVKYSLDDGATWVDLTANTPTPTITTGNKIKWKGNITPDGRLNPGVGTFSSTGRFTAEANPLSLILNDNFEGETNIVTCSPNGHTFDSLFKNCSSLTSINGLELPATTLATQCYQMMFYGCTSLGSIPSNLLPATTLAVDCYRDMFRECDGLIGMFGYCDGLTSIPSALLPATTLATQCYESMFEGCDGLTSLPSGLLPATTLANSCYGRMFSVCKSLTTILNDFLPATTLANSCYHAMFIGCDVLTTVPENLLPATTLANGCYESMFSNCYSLTKSPILLAPTLANSCYHNMFNCSSGSTPQQGVLSEVTCLATDISAENCTNGWLDNVSANGTFKCPSSTNWSSGANGIPSGWTRQDYS